MKRYTPHVIACAVLLITSGVARVLLHWPPFVEYFTYLLWVHVAIIALALYGSWVLRGSGKRSVKEAISFVRGMPLWLVLLAIPVIVAVAPIGLAPPSMGTTPDGRPARSGSWTEEDGRYYVRFNRGPKVEISQAEYLDAKRGGFVLFSSVWILFSYGLLVMWHHIRRREDDPPVADS